MIYHIFEISQKLEKTKKSEKNVRKVTFWRRVNFSKIEIFFQKKTGAQEAVQGILNIRGTLISRMGVVKNFRTSKTLPPKNTFIKMHPPVDFHVFFRVSKLVFFLMFLSSNILCFITIFNSYML